ncbi:SIS domain-containing protein, partial [candidate division KSB1 bacterium]|nr:SIS domain-containing protein [candidate division KSB1 bacterium]
LNGSINKDVNRFKAMSLTDNVPFILALANDEGYGSIFEQQLRTYGEKDDVVIAISGSGNSENVLNAVHYAKSKNMVTIGMTGFNGGKLRRLTRHCVHVPIDDMGITEAVHGIILHYVVDYLKNRLTSNIKYIEKVTSVFDEEVEESHLVKSRATL